jgi:diadenosine tetraphosphate (Ap4A) HIT family hydrolase
LPSFTLDPRIAADTLPVTRLALCEVRLMRDANYPWLILVPARPDLIEILDLDEADRRTLMDEIAAAATALRAAVACDKLNIAALGNSVSQLHVHVIARTIGDAAWPRPVWGAVPARAYPAGAAEALVASLAACLSSSKT